MFLLSRNQSISEYYNLVVKFNSIISGLCEINQYCCIRNYSNNNNIVPAGQLIKIMYRCLNSKLFTHMSTHLYIMFQTIKS